MLDAVLREELAMLIAVEQVLLIVLVVPQGVRTSPFLAFHSCGVQDMPVEMAALLPSTVMRQISILTGSAWREYQKGCREICGVKLPEKQWRVR